MCLPGFQLAHQSLTLHVGFHPPPPQELAACDRQRAVEEEAEHSRARYDVANATLLRAEQYESRVEGHHINTWFSCFMNIKYTSCYDTHHIM